MQTLVYFFMYIINAVRAMIGLISPIFAEATDFKNWPAWMRFLMAVVFLAAICFGLYLIGEALNVRDWVGKAPNPIIQNFFLPIFFLLCVAFSWLAYFLWNLLTSDQEAADFPDILEQWEEAKRRLAASDLDVKDVPLYLMLGRPAEGFNPLFLATGVNGIIRTPPEQRDPSIRIYAWNSAIFVVCKSASAWSHFCVLLAEAGVGVGFGQPAAGSANANAGATIGPGQFFEGMDDQSKAELDALLREASRRELTAQEHERLRELAELSSQQPTPVRRVSLSDAERSNQTRRLEYLCKLIRKDRAPWCCVNGLVVLIPWAALESDDLTRQSIGILSQELNTVRSVFRQRYPIFAVVVDLESAEGFPHFVSSFHPEMRKRRIGQRLPLAPALRGDEMRQAAVAAATWIGTNILPAWILRFLRFEYHPEQRGGFGPDVEYNRELYALLRSVYQRGPRLAELLSRGIPPIGGGDEFSDIRMFGGCYLAATGDSVNTQAFVEGVFQRIMEAQDLVSWSPEALAEEKRLNRLTLLGYIGSILVFIISIAASVYLFSLKSS